MKTGEYNSPSTEIYDLSITKLSESNQTLYFSSFTLVKEKKKNYILFCKFILGYNGQ